MVNSISITVKITGNKFDVQDVNNIGDRQLKVLINKKIADISRQILSSINNSFDIKQINFIFENREVKVVLQQEKGDINYDIGQLDKGLTSLIQVKQLVQDHVMHPTPPSTPSKVIPGLTEQNQSVAVDHFTEQSKRFAVSRLFKSIQRWFSFIFTLDPSIKKLKHSLFENVNHEKSLKEKWIGSQGEVHQFVDHLYQELNQGHTKELFSREELFQGVS